MQQWASSGKWGPSPDLEDLPNLTDPLIVHHEICSDLRFSLIQEIGWRLQFYLFSDILYHLIRFAAVSDLSEANVLSRFLVDFIQSRFPENWVGRIDWNKTNSMLVVRTFVIWPFTQMKLDAADVFCGQIIAAITVAEWSIGDGKKKMTHQGGKFHL